MNMKIAKMKIAKMKIAVKLKIALVSVLLGTSLTYASVAVSKSGVQYSGVNHLNFKKQQYDRNFVGNGFLIRSNGKLYGVTVKHALLEAKTPTMTRVTIDDHIKQWTIRPNKDASQFIKFGKLLNADKNEPIDMNVLSKDWLVFEVEQNNSQLVPVELRTKPIEKGELLTAYGCSYSNKGTCNQDEYIGTFISSDKNNLRMSMENLELNQLRGLSGSPVLDSNNRLVGIVSNLLKSESGEGLDFAPASLTYLREILSSID